MLPRLELRARDLLVLLDLLERRLFLVLLVLCVLSEPPYDFLEENLPLAAVRDF